MRLAMIVLITFAMLVVAITLAILTRTNVRGRPERSPDIGKASSSGRPVDTRELKGWFAFLAPTKAGQYEFDIYVFANGGTAVPVTTGPAADLAPDWSPDGSRIAFARNEDARLDTTEDFDLWTVDIDGGLLTRLTDTRRRSSLGGRRTDRGSSTCRIRTSTSPRGPTRARRWYFAIS